MTYENFLPFVLAHPVYVDVVQGDGEEEGSVTAASSGAETQETDWRTTGEECECHQRTRGCPGKTE